MTSTESVICPKLGGHAGMEMGTTIAFGAAWLKHSSLDNLSAGNGGVVLLSVWYLGCVSIR